MKKLLFILMTIILIVPAFSKADELEDELAGLQGRIRDTQKKIEQARSYQKALTSQYKEAFKNMMATKEEMDIIGNRIVQTGKDITATKKDIAATKSKITTKGVEVDNKRINIGQLLTVIHKYRNTRFVDYVFSANDFSELLTRNRLMNQLLKGAIEAIIDLQDESIRLIKLRENLKNKETKLNEQLAQVKLDRQRAQNLKNHYQETMTQTQNDKEQSKAYVVELDRQNQRDSQAITELIRKIEEEKKRPARGNGKYIWPLANGKVVGSQAEYGWRIHPIWGVRSFHTGLDVDAPLGTPVLASSGGYIELARWFYGYGNCIIINHGNGWSTLYGHLSGYNCRVDQEVKQGDVIGYCGSTGNSTEPHVHFEVRHNGSTDNPRNYLPPR